MNKDLQLMGFAARKKCLSYLFLSSDNKEFASLSRAMAILTGGFSFKRGFFLLCSKYKVSTFLEFEERITTVC